jgi:hypothetical protein
MGRLLVVFIVISLITILVVLIKKMFQKKNYIIPKEGDVVTLKGGLKGTVIGFKGEKVVTEVHLELSDIMH